MTGRRSTHEHGASAVEFALVLPLLVLFLFGIVQFGLAFARTQGMEAAAREGARYASLGRTVDLDEVQDVVGDLRVPFIRTEDIVVEVNDGATGGWCTQAGDPVKVEVFVEDDPAIRARYAITIPLWPGESTPSYAAEGTFRCEARHASP